MCRKDGIVCNIFRREFARNNFSLEYNQPRDFGVSVGANWTSGYYVFYRCLLAGLFLSILVQNGVASDSVLWFIYLTHWGILLQTLHLVVSAAVPIQQVFFQQYTTSCPTPIRGDGDLPMTLLTRFSWLLYNVTNSMALSITAIYWSAVFVPGSPVLVGNILIHAFNSVAAVVDVFVGKRPYRLLHFYQPVLVALVYAIFSVVYWAAGGRTEDGSSYIYSVLNWENLSMTLPFVLVGVLVVVPVVHALLWALHQLRDYFLACCCGKASEDDPSSRLNNRDYAVGRTNTTFSTDDETQLWKKTDAGSDSSEKRIQHLRSFQSGLFDL